MPVRRLLHLRRAARLAALVAAAACEHPLGAAVQPPVVLQTPTAGEILAQRDRWLGAGVTHYAFVYEETGFLICCTEGRPLVVEVQGDSLLAAVPVSGPPCGAGCGGKSIATLFDLAVRAANDGVLTTISFDPVLHYPTRMDLAGPPDASGSELASDLKPLP